MRARVAQLLLFAGALTFAPGSGAQTTTGSAPAESAATATASGSSQEASGATAASKGVSAAVAPVPSIPQETLHSPGRIYAVGIGVSAEGNPLGRRSVEGDLAAFARAVKGIGQRAGQSVEPRQIVGNGATRENIAGVFKGIGGVSQKGDAVIVYLVGSLVSIDRGTLGIVTQDSFAAGDRPAEGAIPLAKFAEYLTGAGAARVFLIASLELTTPETQPDLEGTAKTIASALSSPKVSTFVLLGAGDGAAENATGTLGFLSTALSQTFPADEAKSSQWADGDGPPYGDADGLLTAREASACLHSAVSGGQLAGKQVGKDYAVASAGSYSEVSVVAFDATRVAEVAGWVEKIRAVSSPTFDSRIGLEATQLLQGLRPLTTIPDSARHELIEALGKLAKGEISADDYVKTRNLLAGTSAGGGFSGANPEGGAVYQNAWDAMPGYAKIATIGCGIALLLYLVFRGFLLKAGRRLDADTAAMAANAAAQSGKSGGEKRSGRGSTGGATPPAQKPAPAAGSSAASVAGYRPTQINPPAAAGRGGAEKPAAAPAPAAAAASAAISSPGEGVDDDGPVERPPSIAELKARAAGGGAPNEGTAPTAPALQSLDDELDLSAGGSDDQNEIPTPPGPMPATSPGASATPAAPVTPAVQAKPPRATPMPIAPVGQPMRPAAATPVASAASNSVDLDLDAIGDSEQTIVPFGIQAVKPAAPLQIKPIQPIKPVGGGGQSPAIPQVGRPLASPAVAQGAGGTPKPLVGSPAATTGLNMNPLANRAPLSAAAAAQGAISPGALPAIIRAWDLEWSSPQSRSRFRLLVGPHLEMGRPARQAAPDDAPLFISLLPVGEDGRPNAAMLAMLSRKALALDLTVEGVKVVVLNKASAHMSTDPNRPYWDWDNPMPGSERLVVPGETLWVSPHFGKSLAPISIRPLVSAGMPAGSAGVEMKFDVAYSDVAGITLLVIDGDFSLIWGPEPLGQVLPGVGDGRQALMKTTMTREGLVMAPLAGGEWTRRQGRMVDDTALLLGGTSMLEWKTDSGTLGLKISPYALPSLGKLPGA